MAEGTAAGGGASAISCTVVTADYRDFRGAVNCFDPLTFRG